MRLALVLAAVLSTGHTFDVGRCCRKFDKLGERHAVTAGFGHHGCATIFCHNTFEPSPQGTYFWLGSKPRKGE